jgi:cell division protein FtsL
MAPASAARLVAPAPDAQPVPGAHDANRVGLTVLGRAELAQRRLRRRARLVCVLAATVVAVSLLVVAAGQAFVAAQQVRLDRLDRGLATAVARDQNLQLTRAQLASPSRILQVAERELGMVVPRNVIYLVPVNPDRSTAPSAPRAAT